VVPSCETGWDLNQLGLLENNRMKHVNVQNGSQRAFYAVWEIAEMFGISRKSVYRLLDRGLLQSSSALRHKMITKRSVEQFIANSSQEVAQ
jgi:predicted DNA-binding protein YlxM (UPF0122 family)